MRTPGPAGYRPLVLRRVAVAVVLVVSPACKGEFGSRCESDKDCDRGLRCGDVIGASPLLNQCTADCAADEDCPDGGLCYSTGVCIRTCEGADDTCPEGATCSTTIYGDLCVPTCANTEECSFAGSCLDGVCRQDP